MPYKQGGKGLPSIKSTLCQGFSRTATYVHHWMLCAQARTDPLLRQQAAGTYQLPRKLATDPPFTCSSHGSWHQIWHRSPHRLLSVPQALSKGMHTEQRSLLEATAQRDFTEQLSTDLRPDFFFFCHEESFAFLLQGKSKISFGCSWENFKSHYILAITAT